MSNNLPIYQNGITLSSHEEWVLVEKAWDQSRKIAYILKNRWPQGYTFQEVKEVLRRLFPKDNINQDSVKRAMSSMTGTKGAPETYQDKHGRWPLVKLDQKKLNPETGINISLYAWNDRYDKDLNHQEIVEMYKGQQQMSFHEELFNSN